MIEERLFSGANLDNREFKIFTLMRAGADAESLKSKRAFLARLAYEKNCIAKYDYIDNRPSRPMPKHETMSAYAVIYGTTIKEMMDCEMQVENFLNKHS